jgi:hypothetical protein
MTGKIGGAKIYAGIGSQQTPAYIQTIMMNTAIQMRHDGWRLRSGGAMGADTAFFAGATPECDIWLPSYRSRDRQNHETTEDAFALAKSFHPAWDKCSYWARALHARNSHIILGRDLQAPVKLVICWTKDGKDSGGTGQGLRIAAHYGISIHNLFFPDVREKYESSRPWQQLQ